MSRTYRRKTKKHAGRSKPGKGRSAEAYIKEQPAVYRNATRVRCAASMSEKWMFHSKNAAIEAAKYNFTNKTKNFRENAVYERAYHCTACGGWHLTKMDIGQWLVRKKELATVNGVELDENGNFTYDDKDELAEKKAQYMRLEADRIPVRKKKPKKHN